MDLRRFVLTSLAGVLAAPLAAEVQQAGKVYHVGYLGVAPPTANETSCCTDATRAAKTLVSRN